MKKLIYILCIGTMMSFAMSCSDDSGPSASDIPDNSLAGETPFVDPAESNVNIPNVGFTLAGKGVVNMNMTGIYIEETGQWLNLQGTQEAGQNIWLEIDGVPRSLVAERNSSETKTRAKALLDLVFLVDNSGSMDEEADSIAAEIVEWSAELATMFDVRLGCVGYNEYTLCGALDMGTSQALNDYLNNREGYNWGINRTYGYAGTNAAELEAEINTGNYTTWGECGGAALKFADKNFKFRNGANRLYVNFTDEPNQPYQIEEYSVESVSSTALWGVHQGTIHTVFSDDYYRNLDESYWTPLEEEKPWLMSEYTGGVTMFAPSDFAGVSLSTLTVTDALRNSYNVKFHYTDDLKSGTHDVKIVILTPDNSVKAVREFTGVDFTR